MDNTIITALPSSYKMIDGFDQLTKQQLLDISINHLLSAGKPGVKENGSCQYAGSGCGAAPFIKEEHRPYADNYGGWPTVSEGEGFSMHEKEFIEALQRAHDNAWVSAKDADAVVFGDKVNLWKQNWKQNIKMICLATGLKCPSGFY